MHNRYHPVVSFIDTGSGAGYCVTRHLLAMADHFEQQLRLCAPSGGKEFRDLQVAALRELYKSLDLEKSLKAIRLNEVEEATERRKALDQIVLPTMKKCGRSTSLQVYQSWYKTEMVAQQLYKLTDIETA